MDRSLSAEIFDNGIYRNNGLVSFHPRFISPYIISPQVHFTPRSFHPKFIHPTFISPHIHFTPHLNYQKRLRLITKAALSLLISILALIEKRLGSNYQLDKQTMLAM